MAKYRIEVDRETCIGDKLCCEEAPETLRVDDELKIVVTDPDGDSPEDILYAAKHCPFEAITLYETATGKKVWPRN